MMIKERVLKLAGIWIVSFGSSKLKKSNLVKYLFCSEGRVSCVLNGSFQMCVLLPLTEQNKLPVTGVKREGDTSAQLSNRNTCATKSGKLMPHRH